MRPQSDARIQVHRHGSTAPTGGHPVSLYSNDNCKDCRNLFSNTLAIPNEGCGIVYFPCRLNSCKSKSRFRGVGRDFAIRS